MKTKYNFKNTLLKVVIALIALSCSENGIWESPWESDPMAFQKGPNMSTPRSFHTATLLNDGTVLICGGYCGNKVFYTDMDETPGTILATAEIYDPKTNKITPTGSLKVERRGHTATLLNDGRVLITGGEQLEYWAPGKKYTSIPEMYDPATGEFTLYSHWMKTPRAFHSATLMPDGKVLLVGGEGAVDSGEYWDPTDERFHWVEGYTARDRTYSHSAVMLNDGRVMICGGSWNPYTARIEFYYPDSNRFIYLTKLHNPRWLSSACKMADGRVFVSGGLMFYEDGDSTLQSAEIFDPATDTVGPTIRLSGGERYFHKSVGLPDGRVLLLGGKNRYGELNTAEIYDPATGKMSKYSNLNTFRRDFTVTVLQDGSLFIAGGQQLWQAVSSTEIYRP